MLTAIACSAQPTLSSNIREKLNAFVESKEYGVHRLSISQDGLNVYQFAQQFALDEELGDKFHAPDVGFGEGFQVGGRECQDHLYP